ncbi:hypothetical protein [Spirosoma radiotolerans]|uniref:Uncharacterized protein n=1 Tax=Spirosoma radiotolerans TaxID=1379870 RepID=A0A0E3ZZ53_9BACT|nr:hypothetical protein [Spirosoma radiotolerans]AKD57450.1 hypothetical protein SD10_23730 [Spirosoma radiotolerans]
MNHTSLWQSDALTLPACRSGYQDQQQAIGRQTEEIDQLQTLLLDVLNRYNYRSLRHSAVEYYRKLNNLRTRLNWLHRDFVCEGLNCGTATQNRACYDLHFGLSVALEHHITTVTDEFERIKADCIQFLSGMMTLNLL